MKATIRQAIPADASQLIEFVQQISAEPDSNILLSPGEFNLSVAKEEEILTRYSESDNSTFLIAEINDEIVGELTCHGGSRQANHHTTILGISVKQGWRNQGIGSQLIERAIEWAKGNGIVTRVELIVFERNTGAIRLYQEYGFEIEGRRRNVIFRNGEYLNDLVMGLIW